MGKTYRSPLTTRRSQGTHHSGLPTLNLMLSDWDFDISEMEVENDPMYDDAPISLPTVTWTIEFEYGGTVEVQAYTQDEAMNKAWDNNNRASIMIIMREDHDGTIEITFDASGAAEDEYEYCDCSECQHEDDDDR